MILFRGKRRRYIETYEFPVALRSKLVTEFGDPYQAAGATATTARPRRS